MGKACPGISWREECFVRGCKLRSRGLDCLVGDGGAVIGFLGSLDARVVGSRFKARRDSNSSTGS